MRFTINTQDFVKALKAAIIATSADETRPITTRSRSARSPSPPPMVIWP